MVVGRRIPGLKFVPSGKRRYSEIWQRLARRVCFKGRFAAEMVEERKQKTQRGGRLLWVLD
jgi:hypothetical protein